MHRRPTLKVIAGEDPLDVLPPVLRLFFVGRLLAPPRSLQGADRQLYPIRFTLGAVTSMLLAIHAALFAFLGLFNLAPLSILCSALILSTVFLLRRGNTLGALGFGWICIGFYLVWLHLQLGPSVGLVVFAFPIVAVVYTLHRPHEWPWRIPPAAFALALVFWHGAVPDLAPALRLPPDVTHLIFCFHLMGALYATMVLASHAAAVRETAIDRIAAEHERGETLLLNILPEPIAARLKSSSETIADRFDEVTVVFSDIVGFTPLSAKLESVALVELLNKLFSEFDRLADEHGVEKIKTIGDAYMAVAGLPEPAEDHAARAARFALAMREVVESSQEKFGYDLGIRIGLHSGPAVAGVIGINKFAYDLWGDTVNTASRMESHGQAGRIHLSHATRELLDDEFELEARGDIEVKGKGAMSTWFLKACALPGPDGSAG